jgi:hypothetical protein
MKVSFTIGMGQDMRVNNISTRVLTSNLLRNDKLDVTFLNAPIMSHYHSHRSMNEYFDVMEKKDRIMKEATGAWYNPLRVALGNYQHNHLILDELKTDILFQSCSVTLYEINTLAAILNSGVRLMIGGPLPSTYSFDGLRDIIAQYVKPKYMKNLMIVKGYVDLTTDLHKLAQDWKDTTITENDYSTFWDCEDDYTIDKINRMRRFNKHIDMSFMDGFFPYKYSTFILDNKCWWGKCKFCTYYKYEAKDDFTGGEPVEKITQNILNTIKKQGNNAVFFVNDYFQFTPKYKAIMDILKENEVHIVIFTGVQMLKDRTYLENVNKYVSAMLIGIESFSDFGLDYINKGYKYADIKEANDMMKKHLKRDCFLQESIIIDLPEKHEKDVLVNYTRAATEKEDMRNAGFSINYSIKPLLVNYDTKDAFIDNKWLSVNEDEDEYLLGRHLVFKYLREMGIATNDIYKQMSVPLVRYDQFGDKLESDFRILPYDLAMDVFRWKGELRGT